MEPRSTPDFILEAFADPASVRDVVRGILHTIFFNRFFPSILPQTRDVLDLTLPHVADVELETMIDQRTAALMRQLDADRNQPHHHPPLHHGTQQHHHQQQQQQQQHSNNGSGRGQIVVQFYERRRRKTSGWYPLRGGEEEVCWESWTVKVTVAEPRTESGESKPWVPALSRAPDLLCVGLPQVEGQHPLTNEPLQSEPRFGKRQSRHSSRP
jgi:hypothetical protein